MDGSLRVGAWFNKTNRLAVVVSAGKTPGKQQMHMAVTPVRSVLNAGASKPRQRTKTSRAGPLLLPWVLNRGHSLVRQIFLNISHA